MDLDRLRSLLKCVECDCAYPTVTADAIECANCAARWRQRDGIYDLTPRSSLPLPRMYQDPHIIRWREQSAAAQEYFYMSNGLIRWVQNATHRAIKRMNTSPEVLTLDLGCGDGAHRPFMSGVDNVVGLDIDQASLKNLRKRYPDFLAIRGDCYRLPFVDGSFDQVICSAILEHLIHLDFALEEVNRVLKPAGRFLVSVPTEGGLAWAVGRSLTSARRFTADGLDYRRSNAIDHCNCIWQIEKALLRHFHIQKRYRFPLPIPSYHLSLIVSWRLGKR